MAALASQPSPMPIAVDRSSCAESWQSVGLVVEFCNLHFFCVCCGIYTRSTPVDFSSPPWRTRAVLADAGESRFNVILCFSGLHLWGEQGSPIYVHYELGFRISPFTGRRLLCVHLRHGIIKFATKTDLPNHSTEGIQIEGLHLASFTAAFASIISARSRAWNHWIYTQTAPDLHTTTIVMLPV